MNMQNEGIRWIMCPNLNQHIYLSFYDTRQTLLSLMQSYDFKGNENFYPDIHF